MWRVLENGCREFLGGKMNWSEAASEARNCNAFLDDVEEEMVADEPRSCYNCRYRRWTAYSFICLCPFEKIRS